MATLYENHITGDDHIANVAGINWASQTFTPSVSHTVTTIKLKLYRVGSPDAITVSIRATSSSLPTGIDLCSGTTDGDTLTDSSPGEWREITLGAGTALTTPNEYAICVRALSGTQWTHYFNWRRDSVGGYADGQRAYSTNSGSSWTGVAGHDLMFEEWGEAGANLPVVYTQACTGTIAEKSTGWGILNSIGGAAVTAHGHCWNTTVNPTTSPNSVDNGAKPNLGQFQSAITGLTPSTTYYVRAYATNSSGTAYGQNVTIGAGSTIGRRHVWIEGTELHYFDEYGTERKIEGLAVTSGFPWWHFM